MLTHSHSIEVQRSMVRSVASKMGVVRSVWLIVPDFDLEKLAAMKLLK